MMFLSITLLYWYFSCYSCEFIISDLTEIPDMEGFRTANLSGILQTNSVVECAIGCANYLSCASLSYHSTKGSCLLHSFLFNMNTTEVTCEDDWKSYYIDYCPIERGYQYNRTLHWCYRLVEGNQMQAREAFDFCRNDGARMIRINSQERQLHVMDLLFSHGVSSVWIGGSSADRDDSFVYEDGSPLSYFNWKSNHLNGRKYIKALANCNYEWDSGDGSGNRDFLCERSFLTVS